MSERPIDVITVPNTFCTRNEKRYPVVLVGVPNPKGYKVVEPYAIRPDDAMPMSQLQAKGWVAAVEIEPAKSC